MTTGNGAFLTVRFGASYGSFCHKRPFGVANLNDLNWSTADIGLRLNERRLTDIRRSKAVRQLSTIRAPLELRSSCRYGGGGTAKIDVPDFMRVTEPAAPRFSSIRLSEKKRLLYKSIWTSLKVFRSKVSQTREVSMSSVVSVLTQESPEAIIAAGGTEAWALDRKRASSSDFLMCCRKSGNLQGGNEEVGAAFLIGRVKDVVPSKTSEGRWKITIRDYALVEYADQWDKKKKNPVAYWKTEDYPNALGKTDYLDLLDFKLIERVDATVSSGTKPMTVAEAKAGLALTFGVDESAIEITIRM